MVPGNNGMFQATVVRAGIVVAVRRRAGRGTVPAIAVEPFTDLSPEVAAAVRQRSAALR
jgi:hypothetical protein